MRLTARSLVLSLSCAATALLIVGAGCNILGPAIILAKGPPKTEAMFILPPDRATLIFIDDRSNHLPRRSLRQTIAARAGDVLLESKSVTRVIEPRAGLATAASELPGDPMNIATLGKNALADIVVYATVDSYTERATDTENFSPTIVFRVKVIDCATGARLWPEERAGHPISVQLPPTPRSPTSAAEVAQAQQRIGDEAGLTIAQLFITHETRRPLSER